MNELKKCFIARLLPAVFIIVHIKDNFLPIGCWCVCVYQEGRRMLNSSIHQAIHSLYEIINHVGFSFLKYCYVRHIHGIIENSEEIRRRLLLFSKEF